jgi:DNA-binding transcriptional LysR family regulator
VREAIEDALRGAGVRARDFDARLELGLQESVRTAVEAGYGVTFISRSAIEAALAAGTLAEAHVDGLEPTRDIFLARSPGRSLTRAAQAFLDLARERLAA